VDAEVHADVVGRVQSDWESGDGTMWKLSEECGYDTHWIMTQYLQQTGYSDEAIALCVCDITINPYRYVQLDWHKKVTSL
jgi:hypothetical protein